MNRRSRVRRRRLAKALKVGALALIQLHLFFVLELHHHDLLIPRSLLAAAAARPSGGDKLNSVVTLHLPGTPLRQTPLCAACQVARHGSVLIPGVLALPQVPLTARAELAPVPCFIRIPHCIRSGRSPPVSS